MSGNIYVLERTIATGVFRLGLAAIMHREGSENHQKDSQWMTVM